MKIKLSPRRADAPTVAHVSGDVITIDGTPYDFAPLGEGDDIEGDAIASDNLTEMVTRKDGVICLTLVCHIGPDAPLSSRFPANEYIDVEGEVPVLAFGKQEDVTPFAGLLNPDEDTAQ